MSKARQNVDKLNAMLCVLDYGAVADNATDNKAAFDAAIAAALSKGLAVYIPGGKYYIASNLATITVADQSDLVIFGDSRDVTYIRFGGTCTKGFDFNSTTITPNALPRFEMRNLTITTNLENIGPALDCEWAIDADIEDPFMLNEVSIQGDIRQSPGPSGYGYWSGGVRLARCRNSNIQNFRFTGEMDRASNKTAYGFLLEQECTSFRISNGLILEAEKGVQVNGATEGLYFHNVDIVSVNIGVDFNPSGALEPQVVFTDGHIAAMQVGLDLYDIRYFRVDNSFLLGKGSFGSFNPSQNWIGVRVSGSLSGWGAINAEFSKEDGHGSGGATSTGVSLLTGDGIEVRGSVHAYDGADPIDYGVRMASGVTRSYANIQTRNVTTDYDYNVSNGNTIIRRNASEMQVFGGNDQFFSILGQLAAYLKLYDVGAASNRKETRIFTDAQVLTITYQNDDGTVRLTPVVMDDGGTWRAGADSTFAFGADSIRWAVAYFDNLELRPDASRTPANNGDVTLQATSNTSLTFKLKGSDGVVRSGSITLS